MPKGRDRDKQSGASGTSEESVPMSRAKSTPTARAACQEHRRGRPQLTQVVQFLAQLQHVAFVLRDSALLRLDAIEIALIVALATHANALALRKRFARLIEQLLLLRQFVFKNLAAFFAPALGEVIVLGWRDDRALIGGRLSRRSGWRRGRLEALV